MRIVSLMTVALFLFSCGYAADDLDALKKRFKERYPDIRKHKDAGKIGETTTGTLEAVKEKYLEDGKLKKLIEGENADRASLYKILATKNNTTVELIAERTAKMKFERAKVGDYLKDKDGTWKQKEKKKE